MSDQPKRPDWGWYHQHPSRARGDDAWYHEDAPKTVSADLAAQGWRAMATVPKNRYVALYFRDGTMGDYEGACAYVLEDNHWHAAGSDMIFQAQNAKAWKPWRKQEISAQPQAPKGRRG
jgi:hypothetical protein